MDTETKKKVLRKLPYGLYVLTAKDGGDVAAATVSWLSQASFEPPLIMVAIRGDSHVHEVVERSRSFAVNIVGAGQKAVASAFFKPSKLDEGRINGYAIESGPETEAPLLTEAIGWIEAKITDEVKRGDHTVYVAEIVSAGLRAPEATTLELTDTEWSYAG